MEETVQQVPEPTKTSSSGLPPPESLQPPRACSRQRDDVLPSSQTRSSPAAIEPQRQVLETSPPIDAAAPPKPRNKKNRKRDRSDTSSRQGCQVHSSSPANNPVGPPSDNQPKTDSRRSARKLAESLIAGECVKIVFLDAGIRSSTSGTVTRVWDGSNFELRTFGNSSRFRRLEGGRQDQLFLRFPTARFALLSIVRISGPRFRRKKTCPLDSKSK